jgi:anti-anti-sigma regulatory factor
VVPREVPAIVCDVGALEDPDLCAVELLARLHLTALRGGCRVRVRNACPELAELLAFAGLDEVLGLEARRQPEEREERVGVEEERELGDSAV